MRSIYMSMDLPEISLEPLTHGSRLLHLHQNVPGVMSSVNSVLGNHGVNIDRQQLATRGQQGYVVTDTSGEVPQSALDEIRELEATTRLTVLTA
ncbi:ACT domain-containing protein [Gulosibacter sediminis]|uniref:ACT domain-containing protein n=1 Tax=Gulosibacter sediminis TaxID=1729695 RepID=UPI0024A9C1C8|nr:ACT domain-containing protein [Gulosibacter sediminis]